MNKKNIALVGGSVALLAVIMIALSNSSVPGDFLSTPLTVELNPFH